VSIGLIKDSPNFTDLRPPNRTPSADSLPSRCLYQTPAAMGERAEHPSLTPRRAPGSPKCARRPCKMTAGDSKKFLVLFFMAV
jgi:hypothetical protein